MSDPTRSRYDVIVVGARVAGATTALLLARAGLDVLVLDREAPGLDTLSTHALMRGAVVRLEQLGLLDDVAAAGTPAIERVVFHYGDELETVDLTGRGALYAPRRNVLDPIIERAAVAAGAEVHHRTVVEDLRHDPVTGRVTGLVARDLDAPAGTQSARHLTARHVVVAGGRNTPLVQHLDAPVQHRGTVSGGVAFRYVAELPIDGYEWIYRPTGGAGLIPTNGGRTCVWVGAPTPRFLAERHVGVDAWFDAALRTAAPDVAELLRWLPSGRTWAFAGQPSLVRQPWGPGWALVGDAGAFRDPITSHGITDALRDAGYLADALVAVHDLGDDETSAFTRYRNRRDRLALPIVEVTDRIASHDWDLVELRELLLELSSLMRLETAELRADEHVAAPVGA
jgi:flavin-dependent dehydrogenase